MDSFRFILPAFLFFSVASANAAEPMRICYFSLNNQKEVQATRDFMNKLNTSTGINVEVKEFLTEGGNPNDAFKKMVESGVKCDGLVISGHHTGAWGGHRGKGKLSLDVIESLSCNPKHADWFRNINATWLQGCRTLGVGEIEINDQQIDADYHTNRVGQVLQQDGLTQSYAELNMEFSSTLDQDNPLASRYLRLFPSSKLFGWTKSAPGEKVGSWKSLLFHMAQVSRLMDEGDQYPTQTPTAESLTADSAARYANAVLLTLSKFSVDDRACEEIATQAWLAHGNVGKPAKYFFDNPDLKTLPSLASTGDDSLLQAKKIDCLLKDALKTNSAEKLTLALDMIAQNPDYLHYSFNTIVDVRASLEKKKSPVAQVLIEKMRQHPQINEFLAARLKSKQTGTLRKIDYYRFSQDLTGEDDEELEKQITDAARKELLRPLPALDPTAVNPARSRSLAVDFRATLFQSVLKNRLAKSEYYNQILEGNPEEDVLMQMTKNARRFNSQDATINLLQIAYSPKATVEVANAVLNEMAAMQLPAQEYNSYHQQITRRFANGNPAPVPGGQQPQRQQPRPQPQQNVDPIGNFFRGLF